MGHIHTRSRFPAIGPYNNQFTILPLNTKTSRLTGAEYYIMKMAAQVIFHIADRAGSSLINQIFQSRHYGMPAPFIRGGQKTLFITFCKP